MKSLVSHFTPILSQHDINQTTTKLFKYENLNEVSYVMITNKTPQNKLDMQFIGPFKGIKREDNNFTIDRDGNQAKVHISRIIPAIELIDS